MKKYNIYNVGVGKEVVVTIHPNDKELVISWIHTEEEMEKQDKKKACTTTYANLDGVKKCLEREDWIKEAFLRMLCGRHVGDRIWISESTTLTFDCDMNKMILHSKYYWEDVPAVISLNYKEVEKMIAIFKKWYKHMQNVPS